MKKELSKKENFLKGIIKENPVLVLLLGLCPALGVTSTAINGMGMGLATMFVLLLSNLVVSLIKNLIAPKVRIPALIVIIASFVTVVDLTMAAYLPTLHAQLGLFIPLIVVNCLVLGRAEAFASKQNISASLIDGIGMGVGFTLALTVLGAIRELLGSLSIFGIKLIDADGMIVFILAPGAFIGLGLMIALMNFLQNRAKLKTA
ncbi:MAG TPA: electron transport complex subunit RsxE [Flavobacteriales bacterium]|jgi:electron transport complex protein RnfE|nr:electron transport complex subunit RsxE [Flavobacteriales bacterium]